MKRTVRLFLLIGAIATVGCGPDDKPLAQDTPRPPGDETSSITTGSCVEQYSLETLENRNYAFDGTVAEITPGTGETGEDVVVFDVRRWYKGGTDGRTTRRAYGFSVMTSAGGGPHSVGERLLVTGDDDIVWECGFTQPYDPDIADDWERTFS
jgi:hypothetical protein